MSWENDERGKPCKWSKTITVKVEKFLDGRVLPADLQQQITEAMDECRQALLELARSGEIYIICVEPELVWQDSAGGDARFYTTRARVRWCKDQEMVARYMEFWCMTVADYSKLYPHGVAMENKLFATAIARPQ